MFFCWRDKVRINQSHGSSIVQKKRWWPSVVMIDLACMKNMRPKTNMEPEHYPFVQDNSLQTCDCFGSMSVLKGVNSFFSTLQVRSIATDLLISVELKFHQVINGQSILSIVMDRDSAIVLCHLVLRTNFAVVSFASSWCVVHMQSIWKLEQRIELESPLRLTLFGWRRWQKKLLRFPYGKCEFVVLHHMTTEKIYLHICYSGMATSLDTQCTHQRIKRYLSKNAEMNGLYALWLSG